MLMRDGCLAVCSSDLHHRRPAAAARQTGIGTGLQPGDDGVDLGRLDRLAERRLAPSGLEIDGDAAPQQGRNEGGTYGTGGKVEGPADATAPAIEIGRAHG